MKNFLPPWLAAIPGLLAGAELQDSETGGRPHGHAVGLGFELLKYVNVLVWPFFKAKLQREY